MIKLRKFVLAWTENGPDGDKLHGESCFTLDEIIHGIHLENCSPSRGYIPAGIREFTGVCDSLGNEIYDGDKVRFSPCNQSHIYELKVKWSCCGTWLLVSDTSYSTWRFSPEANGRDYRCEVVKG